MTLAGLVCGFLVFLGPWRNCPATGSAESCAATSSDAGLLGASILVLLGGIVFLIVAASMRQERVHSDAAGHFGEI